MRGAVSLESGKYNLNFYKLPSDTDDTGPWTRL